MKYLTKFKESFMFDMRFVHTILLDALFYAIFIPFLLLYAYILNEKGQALQSVLGTQDITTYITSASPFEISLINSVMGSFIWITIIGIILLLLIALFSYSLSRYLIWNLLSRQKFRCKKYMKFVLLNIVWIIIITIASVIAVLVFMLAAILLNMLSSGFATIVFAVLLILWITAILYLTFNLYLGFVKTGRIFQSIGNAFKRMDKRVYLLSLPVFIIISFISLLVGMFLTQTLNTIVTVILIILFMGWMRVFVFDVQKEKF